MIVTAPADAGDDDPWTTLLARVPDTARYREFLVLSDDFAWDGERLPRGAHHTGRPGRWLQVPLTRDSLLATE